MKVIVVGAGKVGYYLSKTLKEHGHYPIVIERDRETCSHISDSLGIKCICGDGSTIEALEEADIKSTQSLVAVTGSDETNLISCQLAKKVFNITKTVSRVNNPKNLAVMKTLGVDIPISATDSLASQLEREVDIATIKQIMPLNRGQATISEITLPEDSELDGVRISDILLPDECVIISISRNGDFIIPRGKTTVASGDEILILASNSVTHQLSKAFLI